MVAMDLIIDLLIKAGMKEYEAIALVCQLLEEEAGDFLMMDYYQNSIDRNGYFNPLLFLLNNQFIH